MSAFVVSEPPQPVVCVVDGDPAVRESLLYLCDSNGHHAMGFSTRTAFLRALEDQVTATKCVICEAQLPDGSGVELFQALRQRGMLVPFALLVSRHSVFAVKNASRVGIQYIWSKPLTDSMPLIEFLGS